MELLGTLLCFVALIIAIYSYYDMGLEESSKKAEHNFQKRFVAMRIAFIVYTAGFFLIVGSFSFKEASLPFHAFVLIFTLLLALTYGQYQARKEFIAWRRAGQDKRD